MPKPKLLLQLSDEAARVLGEYSETGMGFYVINGCLPQEYTDRIFVIAGDNYVVPVEDPDFFSIVDLVEGQPLPQELEKIDKILIKSSAPSRNITSLPPGYNPTAGAAPLLGSTILSKATVFYRYVGSAIDPRLSASTLAKDTYLTTKLDQTYANTGFAAVGRYALPLPAPASHVFEYELPFGTSLLVGTVLPSFGQAGGGVEVKVSSATSILRRGSYQHLSDF